MDRRSANGNMSSVLSIYSQIFLRKMTICIFVLVLAGCSESRNQTSCALGDHQECICPSGATGSQACNETDLEWQTCECPNSPSDTGTGVHADNTDTIDDGTGETDSASPPDGEQNTGEDDVSSSNDNGTEEDDETGAVDKDTGSLKDTGQGADDTDMDTSPNDTAPNSTDDTEEGEDTSIADDTDSPTTSDVEPDPIDCSNISSTPDELETAQGCAGVFNPNQILDYHIDIDPNDWTALRAETSLEGFNYYPAQFACSGDSPIDIGIRKKRSGGDVKVGLKLDINEFVDGQKHYGIKKLSLENGVSEGDNEDGAEISAYVSEYLSWRMMGLSGTISSRAAFARVFINGTLLGVYINVEQVDKRFLEKRLGDDTGWLYKKSGGPGDGLKTHEIDGLVDPYAVYFCFWDTKSCDLPPGDLLLQELPSRLNIAQMLRMGAVNAFIGNSDSPLLKNNNYYYYDSDCLPRTYLPWDLDSVMKSTYDVFDGRVPGGVSIYTDVLFSNWMTDYVAILSDLLLNTLPMEVINNELDRAIDVAGAALNEDPYVTGTIDDAIDGRRGLRTWWTDRHAEVSAQVAGQQP